MEKYKCESCDGVFRTSFQLRNHFGMAHPAVKTVIVEVEPPMIKPVLNIWSGEIVDWDPMEQKSRKMKPDELCTGCGCKAYTLERKKIIKTVAGLEREVWSEISWTPLEELEKWHDDKLRTEVRMLEQVRAVNC